MPAWEILGTRNINAIMESLASKLDANQELTFLNRTAVPNVPDEEINAKFTGNVFAADIIADDQEGVVRDTGKFELFTDRVPNLKHGARIGQTGLNFLQRMKNQMNDTRGKEMVLDWLTRREAALLRGIRLRQEALIVAAKLDSVVYDRLGIKITAGFGTPSRLKVTPSTLWSNIAATPITDLLKLNADEAVVTGRRYNRATMSTVDFQNMTKTTEFLNRVQRMERFAFAGGAFSPYDPEARSIAEGLTGFQIEIYDIFYKQENPDGTVSNTRILPTGKVILTNSGDDKNEDVFDFANGIVTESIVNGLVSTSVQGLGSDQYGPVAYSAPTSLDLNPPGLTLWAVARGFPRKHDETESAVLTVA